MAPSKKPYVGEIVVNKKDKRVKSVKSSKQRVKLFKKKRRYKSEDAIIKELQDAYESIDSANIKSFEDIPLSTKTLKGLKENGYTIPTEIQRESISLSLHGLDILGAAKTGSGKTLAFLIPVLESLFCKQWTRLDGIGALIITPTRELAYQIFETLRKVGYYHDMSAGLIIGGKDLHFERKRMDQCNIVICTPGRLLQHMDENPLFSCDSMQILVLDEADRCLDMGFEKTMNSIIENLPPKRQTLLFSATQTKSICDLARLSLSDPMYVSVHEHAKHSTPEALQQSYIVCGLHEKIGSLWSFIQSHTKQKILVFMSSCKQVKYHYEMFCHLRPNARLLALYGSLHQIRRMAVYESFCKKSHGVLFATDIAARGLDFPEVNWVVQLDCPEDANTYIHRVGRTARYQNGGESLLILLPSEEQGMMEQLDTKKIPIKKIRINPNKLQSPHRKMEALLARDPNLKASAQRALVAYVKSVFLMKNKNVFDIHALDIEAYSRSLGLALPPRIRFLQRVVKQQHTTSKSDASGKEEASTSQQKVSWESFSETEDENEVSQVLNFGHDDSDIDEDILVLKRKNHKFDSDEDLAMVDVERKKKILTKAAVAKRILRKKIVANKKVVFDDEGEAIVDTTKERVSELAKEYETENAGGIDIEKAKLVLLEEDLIDKQLFRKNVKTMKMKLKFKKKEQKAREQKRKEQDGSDSGQELSGSTNSNISNYGSSLEEISTDDESQESFQRRMSQKRKFSSNVSEKKKSKLKLDDMMDMEHSLQEDEELAMQFLENT